MKPIQVGRRLLSEMNRVTTALVGFSHFDSHYCFAVMVQINEAVSQKNMTSCNVNPSGQVNSFIKKTVYVIKAQRLFV